MRLVKLHEFVVTALPPWLLRRKNAKNSMRTLPRASLDMGSEKGTLISRTLCGQLSLAVMTNSGKFSKAPN